MEPAPDEWGAIAAWTFATAVASTDKTDSVSVRWHYDTTPQPGGWSRTQKVIPN